MTNREWKPLTQAEINKMHQALSTGTSIGLVAYGSHYYRLLEDRDQWRGLVERLAKELNFCTVSGQWPTRSLCGVLDEARQSLKESE